MNRLGLKISCLVAAMVIWMQVASTSMVEQDLQLPVRVIGLAPGLTIAGSEIPDRVRVRLTGSKLRLLRHKYLHHLAGEVRLDLGGYGPGPAFPLEIKPSDVFTSLSGAMVYPPVTARIRIDHLDTLRAPVRLRLEGSLPAGKGFLVPVQVAPDSVRVSGPRRLLSSPLVVATEAVDLARISGDEKREVPLAVPEPLLTVEPSRVVLDIRVGDLQDRTLANVPVIALVDAGRPEAGVSPPVADVKVRGVADSVRVLTRDRLLVTIPVGDRPEGVYTLPGQVTHPSWLQILGVVPPDFRVIVGKPPLPAAAAADSAEVGDE